jgi:hypothetical protein
MPGDPLGDTATLLAYGFCQFLREEPTCNSNGCLGTKTAASVVLLLSQT